MTTYNHLSFQGETTLIILSLQSFSFLHRLVWAQPSTFSEPNPGQNYSPSMWLVFIVLLVVLFFLGFFSIYIRRCTEISSTRDGSRTRRITAGSTAHSRRASRGLDPTIIKSFPTFDYFAVKSSKIGRGALECAICLTEFEDDDTLRLIPKCDHVFHPECIDTWLAGQTTCPVCRANLTEPARLDITTLRVINPQNNVVLRINENGDMDDDVEECESIKKPLHGRVRRSHSMIRNLSIGRPRWIGKHTRSFSTGHVAVKQWEDVERFTLRLPNEVRNQIMSGKLERSTSLVILPIESSTRKGYRFGFEEGTSKWRSKSVRSNRIITRSDQWIFTLIPPFISRASFASSSKDVVCDSIKDGS